MKAAIYARVSTVDQEPENQLQELRRYVAARGWTATEFVDHGVSGAKDRRPALDALLRDAKRRRFDSLVCWRLDRLGRNLKHLVTLLDELQALGIGFVTLNEGIDTTTPAGRLQLHVLSAISQFERDRIYGSAASCSLGVHCVATETGLADAIDEIGVRRASRFALPNASTRLHNTGDGLRFLDSHWYTTALPAAPMRRANAPCVRRSCCRNTRGCSSYSVGTSGSGSGQMAWPLKHR